MGHRVVRYLRHKCRSSESAVGEIHVRYQKGVDGWSGVS
jgi:hypothetical protein